MHVMRSRPQQVIAQLYSAYDNDPSLMTQGWAERLPPEEPARSRHIADFIAGMTDNYAIRQYERLFGSVPEGLSNV